MRRIAIPILLLSLLAACAGGPQVEPWQDQQAPTDAKVRTTVIQHADGTMTVDIAIEIDMSGDIGTDSKSGDAASSATADVDTDATADVSGIPGG